MPNGCMAGSASSWMPATSCASVTLAVAAAARSSAAPSARVAGCKASSSHGKYALHSRSNEVVPVPAPPAAGSGASMANRQTNAPCCALLAVAPCGASTVNCGAVTSCSTGLASVRSTRRGWRRGPARSMAACSSIGKVRARPRARLSRRSAPPPSHGARLSLPMRNCALTVAEKPTEMVKLKMPRSILTRRLMRTEAVTDRGMAR